MGSGAVAATETRLLDGRVVCLQPASGYRSAMDSVFLAAAVPAAPGDHVLELGCGAGAAAFCLARRCPEARVSGLELQPAMLWRMRHRLIGLGGLQVSLTTGLIAAAAVGFGLPWQSAVAIGMVLALSSTAIVLQTLNEKGWMKTTGGQSSFSVLLTQDIAVIPMLALLPLLAVGGAMQGGAADPHAGGALDALPGWLQTLAILAVIAAIIVAGRYLVRPVFRFIAESRLREIFTAAALLLVIGTATSPAGAAVLAGDGDAPGADPLAFAETSSLPGDELDRVDITVVA